MKNYETLKKLSVYGFENKPLTEYPFVMGNNKMKIKWNSIISGIYIWINKTNNKFYIGKGNNLYRRVYDEKNQFQNNRHGNLLKLYNAVKKYGIDNFEVRLLLETEKNKLFELETLFIQFYDTKENGYNISLGGEGCLGHNVSDKQIKKQKEKMSLYWTEERKKQHSEKMKIWFNNKTNEEKQQMIDGGKSWILDDELIKKQKENYIKTLTPKRIEKQRNSLLEYYKNNDSKKLIKKEIISPENKIINLNGLSDFCKKYHVNYSSIKNVLLGKIIHHRGWHIDPTFIYIIPLKKRLIDPYGILYEFDSIHKFCKEYNLSKSSIIKLLKGEKLYYKKWRLETTPTKT